MVEVAFWGVRGSIASPGEATAGVGGNTSCVEVRAGSTRIVLDAGTGLRRLGDRMLADGAGSATLLLSHLHWDHIQGLPFFVPAYLPTTRLKVVGTTHGPTPLREALAKQMAAPNFPVRFEELAAAIETCEVRPRDVFKEGPFTVTVAKLNHPGGVLAYRLDVEGRSIVYATDTEHYACVDPTLLDLAQGADVLVYDAQYTPSEYRGEGGRSKVGWGHSTYVAGAEMARLAKVGTLVLFHHDPARNDAGVAAIERDARALFPASIAAREGLVLPLAPVPTRSAAPPARSGEAALGR